MRCVVRRWATGCPRPSPRLPPGVPRPHTTRVRPADRNDDLEGRSPGLVHAPPGGAARAWAAGSRVRPGRSGARPEIGPCRGSGRSAGRAGRRRPWRGPGLLRAIGLVGRPLWRDLGRWCVALAELSHNSDRSASTSSIATGPSPQPVGGCASCRTSDPQGRRRARPQPNPRRPWASDTNGAKTMNLVLTCSSKTGPPEVVESAPDLTTPGVEAIPPSGILLRFTPVCDPG